VSIVESLKRIVDPVEARAREEELRVQREQPKRERDGDPPSFVCRVCGHEGTEPDFCPSCLAETMIPAASRAKP
jgi:rubrerythrin